MYLKCDENNQRENSIVDASNKFLPLTPPQLSLVDICGLVLEGLSRLIGGRSQFETRRSLNTLSKQFVSLTE